MRTEKQIRDIDALQATQDALAATKADLKVRASGALSEASEKKLLCCGESGRERASNGV
jgi:hypothetical protein